MASISRSTLLFLFLVVLLRCSETHGETIHLHFYLHENLSGPNATLVPVVNPPKNGTSFGTVGVIDDMLREGSDPSSKLIGRAQGLFTIASLENNNDLLTTINLVFTEGPYNGSSLAVFGRIVLFTLMERSIVGGTGAFRMARGYLLSKNLPAPQGFAILECDAYVSL